MDEMYGHECLKELKESGFDTEGITPAQAEVILIPSHAPENYMCDGEISRTQALTRWKQKLVSSGLTPAQVSKVVKHTFI
mgnify:CR=1 FL=1